MPTGVRVIGIASRTAGTSSPPITAIAIGARGAAVAFRALALDQAALLLVSRFGLGFAAVALGDTLRAECTPLHRGRTTMVWQTRITRGDGKLAAIVTQTQLIFDKQQ